MDTTGEGRTRDWDSSLGAVRNRVQSSEETAPGMVALHPAPQAKRARCVVHLHLQVGAHGRWRLDNRAGILEVAVDDRAGGAKSLGEDGGRGICGGVLREG